MQSVGTTVEKIAAFDRTPLWRVAGSVQPPPLAPFYKVGLAAVALAVIFLPPLYLVIIAATAYGVYDQAVTPSIQFGEHASLGALLVYVAPVVIGSILVFFMIKPLFARRIKATEPLPITRDDEPELFRFIDTICDLVCAPRPRRVLLDLQGNASASFRRGVWSFLGRDLALTVGLPLVAGLTVRQFGGVLAHEFGHFAQGAGMRLTFIVRSVNAWFARLVFERDAWDERLRQAAARGDFRIALVLQLARLAIWVTRRILWLLMTLGRGISCFMLRQMEFDADRFEAQVAGSEEFAATTRRLRLLGVSWQQVLAHQREAFATKRLVDDLPGLVALRTKRLPEETQRRIGQSLCASKTGWFDTHPSDRDRVAAAQALDTAGVLHGESPATALFVDFARVAQSRTAAYYREDCEIVLDNVRLHSIEEMSVEAETAADEDKSRSDWFGPLLTTHTLLVLTPEDVTPRPGEASGESIATRERHAQLLEDARPAIEALLEADAAELIATKALALLNAGFRIKHKEFGLKSSTREAAADAIAQAARRVAHERTRLVPAQRTTRQRLAAALQIYRTSQSGDSEVVTEIERLTTLLARFGGIAETLAEIRRASSALELLLQNSVNASNTNLWNATARELARTMDEGATRVAEAFSGFDYPFPHADGAVPLPEFLAESEMHPGRIVREFLCGRAVLDRSFSLYHRIMGRLAFLAQRAGGNTPAPLS